VTVAWDAVSGAESYLIEVGSASGLSNIAILPVAVTTLSVGGAPSGTYFLRVRAVAGGITGAASTEIGLVVP
jgi:hypothetical protein